VPNWRALASPLAPTKVSTGGPSPTSTRPTPEMMVCHPAHGRAPAIHPVDRSMAWKAASRTGRSTQMSARDVRVLVGGPDDYAAGTGRRIQADA
jgi:hypothetical protein